MGTKNVVIDTNVLISALLNPRGKSREIYTLALRKKFNLFISEALLDELKRVLEYPKFEFSGLEKEIFLRNILRIAILVETKRKVTIIKEDPPDNEFINCALEAKADYIVSGDPHLNLLKEYSGIKILPPAEFLQEIGLSVNL